MHDGKLEYSYDHSGPCGAFRPCCHLCMHLPKKRATTSTQSISHECKVTLPETSDFFSTLTASNFRDAQCVRNAAGYDLLGFIGSLGHENTDAADCKWLWGIVDMCRCLAFNPHPARPQASRTRLYIRITDNLFHRTSVTSMESRLILTSKQILLI